MTDQIRARMLLAHLVLALGLPAAATPAPEPAPAPAPGEGGAAWVYWRSERQLGRVRADGSGAEVLLDGVRVVAGPTIDHEGRRLYWSERPKERAQARILSSELDGSQPREVLSGLWPMDGLCVAGIRLLWSRSTLGRIERADLDGGGREDLALGHDLGSPTVLAAAGETVVWLDHAANAIRRFDPEAGRVLDVLPPVKAYIDKVIDREVSGGPQALAAGGGRLYWSEPSGGLIMSCRLDGSDLRQAASGDTPMGVDFHRGRLYWADVHEIRRGRAGGSASEAVIAGESLYPRWLAVTGDWIYYAEAAARRIRRVRHDGSGVEELVSGGELAGLGSDVAWPMLSGIAFGGGKLYWSESMSGRILRSDPGGGHVEVVASDLSNPGALHFAGGLLYWSSRDGIRRSAGDGSRVERLTGQNGAGLAVAGKALYFADDLREGVFRLPLDGRATPEEVVSRPLVQAVIAEAMAEPEQIRNLRGLAVDRGRVYWSELAHSRIRAADLDGTGAADVVTGAVLASAVAVRGGTVCWAAYQTLRCADLVRPDEHRTLFEGPRFLALAMADDANAPHPESAELQD